MSLSCKVFGLFMYRAMNTSEGLMIIVRTLTWATCITLCHLVTNFLYKLHKRFGTTKRRPVCCSEEKCFPVQEVKLHASVCDSASATWSSCEHLCWQPCLSLSELVWLNTWGGAVGKCNLWPLHVDCHEQEMWNSVAWRCVLFSLRTFGVCKE